MSTHRDTTHLLVHKAIHHRLKMLSARIRVPMKTLAEEGLEYILTTYGNDETETETETETGSEIENDINIGSANTGSSIEGGSNES